VSTVAIVGINQLSDVPGVLVLKRGFPDPWNREIRAPDGRAIGIEDRVRETEMFNAMQLMQAMRAMCAVEK
jgi:hypothetical protein